MNENRSVRCEWCGKRLGTAWAWAERVRSHGYEWDVRYCSIKCEGHHSKWSKRNEVTA